MTSDLRVPPDYVLQGRIRRFEQVIGSSPAVIIDVDIGVVRVHGNELLSLKTYRVEKPLSSDQVSEAVHGFEAAVNDLFGQFLTDLSGQRR